MRIGILTSGGDCAGLNAVLRGFGKAIYPLIPNVEIYGIANGYMGLLNSEYRVMNEQDFSGILTIGGTILGTSRMPYKTLTQDDQDDKVGVMKDAYKKMGLNALVVLGGNGSHKTAALLASEGLNVIALPKTIDNDITGTDFTFGFHSAVKIATDCIDYLHTTAASHRRTIIVEIMGNKAGWLTLYSGIAGGANVILLPEIPYSVDKIIRYVSHRLENSGFCIIAAAEGAISKEENELSKKERSILRAARNDVTASEILAGILSQELQIETRVVVPGHIQRGGIPCAYDRILCTQIGSYGAKLVADKDFGKTAALKNGKMTANKLSDVAGVPRLVPHNHELIKTARRIGISFGD